jgi:hypothetical protein
LKILDGQDITHNEKVKADVVFGDDLDKKKEIFCEYLPAEDWVDRRIFFEEQIDPESDSDEEIENMDKDLRKSKTKMQDKLLNSKNNTLSSINDKRTFKEEYGETLVEDKLRNLTYS